MRLKPMLIVLLALFAVGVFVIDSSADESLAEVTSGTTGDCTWELDGTELTISGNGSLEYSYAGNPWGTSITGVTISAGISSIGDYTFSGCSSLNSISLPNSVTTIGLYAFSGCTSLKSISLPNSVTTISYGAFNGCIGLESITIPDSVKLLDSFAFSGCSSLTTITIGNGVTHLGDSAFWGCTSLESITLSYGATYVWEYAFKDCTSLKSISLPNSVTTIGDYAFYGCTSLESIVIPDSVTTIGDYAFNYCTSLESITIPESVTSIGEGAFRLCASISSVTLGNSVETLGIGAFSYCSGLKTLTLPVSLDAVGSVSTPVFLGCNSLETVTFIAGTGEGYNYDESSFIYAPWYQSRFVLNKIVLSEGIASIGSYMFSDCGCVTALIIPDSVVSIGSYSFRNCTGLKTLTIPISLDAVQTNDAPAFSGCSNLEKITFTVGTIKGKDYTYLSHTYTPWYLSRDVLKEIRFSEGITSIGNYAFYSCAAITSIVIPNSVTSLGYSAFRDCSGLTDLTIPINLNAVGSNLYPAFSGCNNIERVYFTVGTGKGHNYSDNPIVLVGHSYYEYTPWFLSIATLKEITLSEGITSIGSYAFYSCTSLTSIVIPDSVTSLGTNAFNNCTGLANLTIPISLDAVGSEDNPLFAGCTNIKRVVFTTGSGKGVSYADDYHEYAPWYLSRNVLTQVIISDGVRSIGHSAFMGCSSLSSLYLGDAISILGDYSFCGCTSLKSLTIPNTVTIIGEDAFFNCCALSVVTFGDSVTTIKDCAFAYCTSLSAIAVPDSTTTIGSEAFSNCSALSSVSLGNSLCSLGNYAFHNCAGLKDLTLPISLNAVGSHDYPAFSGCTNIIKVTLTRGTGVGHSYTDSTYENTPWYLSKNTIKDVVIEDSVAILGEYTFYGCSSLSSVVLGYSLLNIADKAFYGCTSLKSITNRSLLNIVKGDSSHGFVAYYAENVLGKVSSYSLDSGFKGQYNITGKVCSIEEYYGKGTDLDLSILPIEGCLCEVIFIESYTFKDNSFLKSVSLSDHLLVLGPGSFFNCRSLVSISIPDSVLGIGNSAFATCSSLTFISIGKSLIQLDPYAFIECNSLVSITVSKTNANYSSSDGVLFDKDQTRLIQYPSAKAGAEYGVPITVITIEDYAFYNNSSLSIISIPDSVKSIGNNAFFGCSSLTSIQVSESNANYSSLDDTLYDKNRTVLIHYPSANKAETISIPGTVQTIQQYAFCNSTNLKYLVIPDSVFQIGYEAFTGCSGLIELTLPISLNTVSDPKSPIFGGCINLTKVTFTPGSDGTGYSYSLQPDSSNYCGNTPWYLSRLSLKEIVLSDGIISIGSHMFKGCNNVKILTIPTSLNAGQSFDGEGAFAGCTNLTKVTFTKGTGYGVNYSDDAGSSAYFMLTPWYLSRNSLVEIVLSDGIFTVGSYTFFGCSKIKQLTLPITLWIATDSEVTSFQGCTGLRSVTFTPGSRGTACDYSIDPQASNYYGKTPWYLSRDNLTDVVLSDGIFRIGSYTFKGCGNITALTIPDSVTTLEPGAFSDCSGLKSLTLPIRLNAVMDSEHPVFEGCDGLETVTFSSGASGKGFDYSSDPQSSNYYGNTPWYLSRATLTNVTLQEGIRSIGERALQGCVSLTAISLPGTVASIGTGAFLLCSSLKTIMVDPSNKVYYATDGVLFDKIQSKLVQYPLGKISTTYEIPNGINSIEDYAFAYSDLVIVKTHNAVTGIGNYAFLGSQHLASITLGSSVNSIGTDAFEDCIRLFEVVNLSGFELVAGSTGQGHVAFHAKNVLKNADPSTVRIISDRVLGDSAGTTYLIDYVGNSSELDLSDIGSPFALNDYALYRYSSLSSVKLPNLLVSIGAYTFYGCSALSEISVGNLNNDKIGDSAFALGEGQSKPICYVLTDSNIDFDRKADGHAVFYRLTVKPVGGSVSTSYDGNSAGSKILFGDSMVRIEGSADETSVGEWTVTVVPAAGYVWTDRTSDAVTYVVTISKANLTDVKVLQSGSFTYDGTDRVVSDLVTASASSVGGQPVMFVYSLEENGTYVSDLVVRNAGGHRIYYRAVADNHITSEGSLTISISKADLRIVAEKIDATYMDPVPDYSEHLTITGLLGNDVCEPSIECSYVRGSNAGTYDIVVSWTSDNYSITVENGVLTVMQASLTISIDSFDTVYYDPVPDYSEHLVIKGLLGNDVCEPSITCAYRQGSPVGDYPITVSWSSANYSIDILGGVLTVKCADLSGVSVSQSVECIYNGYEQPIPLSPVATALNGLAVKFTYSLVKDGEYSKEIKVRNAGNYLGYYRAEADNHNTVEGSFAIEVAKSELTIAMQDFDIAYLSPVPNYTEHMSFTGLQGEDGCEPIIKCEYTDKSYAGKYQITVSWASDDYAVTLRNGTLNVIDVFDSEGAKFRITSPVEVSLSSVGSVSEFSIPGSVVFLSKEYDVTLLDSGSLSPALVSLTIGKNVTEIPSDVFDGISALLQITVAEGNGKYSDKDGILFTGDKLIRCPEGYADAEYAIPYGTETIAGGAFLNCAHLTKVSVPASISSFFGRPFDGCTSLTLIEVDANNRNYSDWSGILFDITANKVLKCPEGYTDSKVEIENDTIKTITIGEGAFLGCGNVSDVYLGATASIVEMSAFDDRPSLAVHAFAPESKWSGTYGRTWIFVVDGSDLVRSDHTVVCSGYQVLVGGKDVGVLYAPSENCGLRYDEGRSALCSFLTSNSGLVVDRVEISGFDNYDLDEPCILDSRILIDAVESIYYITFEYYGGTKDVLSYGKDGKLSGSVPDPYAFDVPAGCIAHWEDYKLAFSKNQTIRQVRESYLEYELHSTVSAGPFLGAAASATTVWVIGTNQNIDAWYLHLGTERFIEIPAYTLEGYTVNGIRSLTDSVATKVVFGSNILDIQNGAFSSCTALETFELDSTLSAGRSGYSTEGGILLSDNGRVLHFVPYHYGSDVVIPSSVRMVDRGAFAGNVRTVFLNDGVEFLEGANCTGHQITLEAAAGSRVCGLSATSLPTANPYIEIGVEMSELSLGEAISDSITVAFLAISVVLCAIWCGLTSALRKSIRPQEEGKE